MWIFGNKSAAPSTDEFPLPSRGAKMFGKLQILPLVIGAKTGAVGLGRRIGESLEHQPSHDLAMFQNERHFARAHFQHGARGRRLAWVEAKSGIEEAGIV